MDSLLNVILLALKYSKKKIIIKKSVRSLFICTKLLEENIIKNFVINKNQLLLNINFYKNRRCLNTLKTLKKKIKCKKK